jgi:L-malate glycosyltransferase
MKNKKHILIISSWYPSRVHKHLGNFVQRFAQLWGREHHVHVVHTQVDPTVKEIEITTNSKQGINEIIAYHPKGRNFLQSFQIQRQAFKLACNKIEHIDLIHAHVLLPKGIQFLWAKKHFKCPLLLTEHGSYFRKENKISFIKQLYLKWIIGSVDFFTTVSEFLKEDLQRFFPKKEIQILPNPIEVADFSKTIQPEEKETSAFQLTKTIEFLHISTLDEDLKNIKGIIDACKLLVKKGITNFHLQIVSDEETIKWETYVYSKKLTNHISFTGATDYEKIPAFYQKADAFVLFSSYETFSIVLAESWASGIPVISTPVGIAFNLDKRLGLSVGINQTKELANAMERMINKEIQFDPVYLKNHAAQFDNALVLKQLTTFIQNEIQTKNVNKTTHDKKRNTPSAKTKAKRKNKRTRKSA